LISVNTTLGVIQGASVTDVRSWGYIVWGILALVIAIPEIVAAFGKEFVPWPGFARTVTHWQARKPWLAALFLAAFAVLVVHIIFYPWPTPVE
jgi:hypothetical protein